MKDLEAIADCFILNRDPRILAEKFGMHPLSFYRIIKTPKFQAILDAREYTGPRHFRKRRRGRSPQYYAARALYFELILNATLPRRKIVDHIAKAIKVHPVSLRRWRAIWKTQSLWWAKIDLTGGHGNIPKDTLLVWVKPNTFERLEMLLDGPGIQNRIVLLLPAKDVEHIEINH